MENINGISDNNNCTSLSNESTNVYKLNHNDIAENLIKNVELISNKSDNSKPIILMTEFNSTKNKLSIIKFKESEILEYIKNMVLSLELYNLKLLCDVILNYDSLKSKTKKPSDLVNEFFSIEGCARGTMLNEKYFYGLIKEVCVNNNSNNIDFNSVIINLAEFSTNEDSILNNNSNSEDHKNSDISNKNELDDKILKDKNDNKSDSSTIKKYDMFFIVNMLATITNNIYQKVPRSKLEIKDLILELSPLLKKEEVKNEIISNLMKTYKNKIESVLLIMEKFMIKHISDFIGNIKLT